MASATELDIVIKAIDEASDQLKKIAANGSDAMKQVSSSSDKAKESNESLTSSVFKATAAWDLFKEGVNIAKDFIMDSIGEYAHASETMAQVAVNVKNAGYSYEALKPRMEEYSANALAMGFQNETTSASLSKLLLITGDYSQAQALTNLAMDLARNKNISLEQATTSLAQVIQGAGGRALMQYGLSFKTGASAAEILTELQDKLKGSTEAFAASTGGKLEIMQTQWNEMKQAVGEQFAPVVNELFVSFEKNLPEITKDVKTVTEVLVALAKTTAAVFDTIPDTLKAVSAGFNSLTDSLNLTSNDAVRAALAHRKVAEATTETKKATNDLSGSLAGVGDNSGKAQVEMIKHAEVVKKLGATYDKLRQDSVTDLADMADSFRDKMKTIQDSIASTTKAISDLTDSYNQAKTSDAENIADKIVASERKIADLKTQIQNASSGDQQLRLQKELEAEQANYDSSLSYRQANANTVAAAETRANKTDLQRAIDTYTAKRQLDDKAYQDKLASLQKQLQDEKDQATAEILLVTTKVAQIKLLLDQANAEYKKQADARVGMTAKEVDQEIAYYNALAAAISRVKSASQSAIPTIIGPSVPKFASGGIVDSPTLALVGEAGPEAIIPLSLLGSGGGVGGGTGGGGITINIQGGTYYTSRQSITEMANQIAQLINQQLKVRNYAT
jgi:hypothetical protein